ncbi:hypothetical protein HK096_008562, partial [Nowakowskiella sp. JEL0078]
DPIAQFEDPAEYIRYFCVEKPERLVDWVLALRMTKSEKEFQEFPHYFEKYSDQLSEKAKKTLNSLESPKIFKNKSSLEHIKSPARSESSKDDDYFSQIRQTETVRKSRRDYVEDERRYDDSRRREIRENDTKARSRSNVSKSRSKDDLISGNKAIPAASRSQTNIRETEIRYRNYAKDDEETDSRRRRAASRHRNEISESVVSDESRSRRRRGSDEEFSRSEGHQNLTKTQTISSKSEVRSSRSKSRVRGEPERHRSKSRPRGEPERNRDTEKKEKQGFGQPLIDVSDSYHCRTCGCSEFKSLKTEKRKNVCAYCLHVHK